MLRYRIQSITSLYSLQFKNKINFVTPTMIDSLLTNYIKLLLLWQQNYNMATFVYIICEIFTCKLKVMCNSMSLLKVQFDTVR